MVELSIIPMGEGTSVSKILARAVKELEKRNVEYEVTPMCTVFEAGSVEEALDIVKAAHEAVLKQGVRRAITTVKLDDRRDVERDMRSKVESLRRELERL